MLLLQIFLSLAGTGFVWLILIGVLFLLFNSGLSKARLITIFSVFAILLVTTMIIGMKYFPDKRLFYLMTLALNNPEALAKSGGFVLRSLNPVHSVVVGLGLFKGMGVGLAFPGEGGGVDYSALGGIFKNVGINISGRSHGGIASLVYELGIFSFPFIGAMFYFILRRFKWKSRGISMRFIVFIFMMITLFEGPISNPILIVVISLFWYLDKLSRNEVQVLHSS